jgi:hypothetical protein
MSPRLGVLDFHPIQYRAQLYQRLESHGSISLDVLYLSDNGYRPAMDPEFGVPVAWDIDLLDGLRAHIPGAREGHVGEAQPGGIAYPVAGGP